MGRVTPEGGFRSERSVGVREEPPVHPTTLPGTLPAVAPEALDPVVPALALGVDVPRAVLHLKVLPVSLQRLVAPESARVETESRLSS